MIPYGILYKENLFGFTESIKLWQKKYGILKSGLFLKLTAVLWLTFIIITALLYILKLDVLFAIVFAVVTAVTNVIIYFNLKNSFVKKIAQANFQPVDKQIVLYDDYLELKSEYSKGKFYYSEIEFAYEHYGVLTIIADKCIPPVSVSTVSMKKGEYEIFLRLLKEKLGTKLEYSGGKR